MSGKEFWSLKATHGLPLSFVIEELSLSGVWPKWDEVLTAATADGVNVRRLVDELKMIFEPMKEGAYLCAAIEELYQRESRKSMVILKATKVARKLIK